MPWREFHRKLVGLLSCDSRVWRFFSDRHDDDPEGGRGEW